MLLKTCEEAHASGIGSGSIDTGRIDILLISLLRSSRTIIGDVIVTEVEHLPCAADATTEVVLAKDEGHACKQTVRRRIYIIYIYIYIS